MMNRVTKGSCQNETCPKISSLDQNESSPNMSKSCMLKQSFVQNEPLSMSESCTSKGFKSDYKQATSGSAFLDRNKPSSISETCVLKGLKGSAQRTEMSGREKLKRHRVEMAGQVWIPDVWGQEGLLKDWAENCNSFDAMRNTSLVSARAALVQEGRIRVDSSLRIENSC